MTPFKRHIGWAVTFALVLFVWPATAAAQEHGEVSDGEVSQVTQQVSQEIYSPYCPGKTLAMCPSSGAADVRQEIQTLASKGMSKPEIKETIIDRYGEEFRLKQPEAKDNMTLLILLALGLLVALAAVFFLVQRKGSAEQKPPRTQREEESFDGSLSEEDEEYLEEVRSDYMS